MAARPSLRTPTESAFGPSEVLAGLASLAGVRLLAVGCGRGELLARAVAAGAQVWGVDESARDLAVAGALVPGADLRLGRADDLPFDTGMFDVVGSFGALGSTVLAAAIVEMTRVCRPGGAVVVWPGAQSRRPTGGDPTY